MVLQRSSEVKDLPNVAPQPMNEHFVQQLIACQDRLYAYILVLLGDANAADDVLQETNLVIARRSAELVEIVNFGAWACRIAHFQILAHFKRRSRDRLLFDDDLLELLAADGIAHTADLPERQSALRQCLGKLSSEQRDLILRRYSAGGSVKQLSREIGQSPGSISQTLYRIRTALFHCVERTLAKELGHDY